MGRRIGKESKNKQQRVGKYDGDANVNLDFGQIMKKLLPILSSEKNCQQQPHIVPAYNNNNNSNCSVKRRLKWNQWY